MKSIFVVMVLDWEGEMVIDSIYQNRAHARAVAHTIRSNWLKKGQIERAKAVQVQELKEGFNAFRTN